MLNSNKSYLENILHSAGIVGSTADILMDAFDSVVASEVSNAKTQMAQGIMRDLYPSNGGKGSDLILD